MKLVDESSIVVQMLALVSAGNQRMACSLSLLGVRSSLVQSLGCVDPCMLTVINV